MNIVIPMAGRGSRLRPHTLTIPKPLIPVANKPMVQRLVEDITEMCSESVDNIGFIIGDFGEEAEKHLMKVAEQLGAKGHIFYQDKPLGTAHAILCAKPLLEGKVVVAFADTLFKANFKIDTEKDGVIYVQKVEDPSAFGVVKLDEVGFITDFVEKPKEFVSDLAIIGIYYVKDAAILRDEMQYLLDNDIKEKGEYQLTNALENMRQKNYKFSTGEVEEWLDCGNKNATVYTNQRILEIKKDEFTEPSNLVLENSLIVPPCSIGENVVIRNSVVGPHVTIGDNTTVENSVIKNTLVQTNSLVCCQVLDNAMIGNHAKLKGTAKSVSLGDYSEL